MYMASLGECSSCREPNTFIGCKCLPGYSGVINKTSSPPFYSG